MIIERTFTSASRTTICTRRLKSLQLSKYESNGNHPGWELDSLLTGQLAASARRFCCCCHLSDSDWIRLTFKSFSFSVQEAGPSWSSWHRFEGWEKVTFEVCLYFRMPAQIGRFYDPHSKHFFWWRQLWLDWTELGQLRARLINRWDEREGRRQKAEGVLRPLCKCHAERLSFN